MIDKNIVTEETPFEEFKIVNDPPYSEYPYPWKKLKKLSKTTGQRLKRSADPDQVKLCKQSRQKCQKLMNELLTLTNGDDKNVNQIEEIMAKLSESNQENKLKNLNYCLQCLNLQVQGHLTFDDSSQESYNFNRDVYNGFKMPNSEQPAYFPIPIPERDDFPTTQNQETAKIKNGNNPNMQVHVTRTNKTKIENGMVYTNILKNMTIIEKATSEKPIPEGSVQTDNFPYYVYENGGHQNAGGYQNPGNYQNAGGYQNSGGFQNAGGYQNAGYYQNSGYQNAGGYQNSAGSHNAGEYQNAAENQNAGGYQNSDYQNSAGNQNAGGYQNTAGSQNSGGYQNAASYQNSDGNQNSGGYQNSAGSQNAGGYQNTAGSQNSGGYQNSAGNQNTGGHQTAAGTQNSGGYQNSAGFQSSAVNQNAASHQNGHFYGGGSSYHKGPSYPNGATYQSESIYQNGPAYQKGSVFSKGPIYQNGPLYQNPQNFNNIPYFQAPQIPSWNSPINQGNQGQGNSEIQNTNLITPPEIKIQMFPGNGTKITLNVTDEINNEDNSQNFDSGGWNSEKPTNDINQVSTTNNLENTMSDYQDFDGTRMFNNPFGNTQKFGSDCQKGNYNFQQGTNPTAESMTVSHQVQITPTITWTPYPVCFYGPPPPNIWTFPASGHSKIFQL